MTLFLWTTNNNGATSVHVLTPACDSCLPRLWWHTGTVWYPWRYCWLRVGTSRSARTHQCQHQSVNIMLLRTLYSVQKQILW